MLHSEYNSSVMDSFFLVVLLHYYICVIYSTIDTLSMIVTFNPMHSSDTTAPKAIYCN